MDWKRAIFLDIYMFDASAMRPASTSVSRPNCHERLRGGKRWTLLKMGLHQGPLLC